jgi:hypothetical protein
MKNPKENPENYGVHFPDLWVNHIKLRRKVLILFFFPNRGISSLGGLGPFSEVLGVSLSDHLSTLTLPKLKL